MIVPQGFPAKAVKVPDVFFGLKEKAETSDYGSVFVAGMQRCHCPVDGFYSI